MQDKRGFLWIGTEAGLSRFDGENFTSFTMKNSGINGNAVQVLFYDETTDRLWVGTKKGLSVLDCRSQKFEEAPLPQDAVLNNVIDIKRSDDGGIWIVNHLDNFIHYNPSDGSSQVYTPKNTGGGLSRWFRSIEEDGNGTIYVGHATSGLSLIDRKSGAVRNFIHDKEDPSSLPGNEVFCIHVDHYGNVWVGTDGGLALYNPTAENFICFRHSQNDPSSLIGNYIYEISEMSDGTLWIGSDIGGVSVLDLRNLTFISSRQSRFVNVRPSSGKSHLSSGNIRTVYEDSFGNIWIGNCSTGLDFISRREPRFKVLAGAGSASTTGGSIQAWSLLSDEEGRLWVGGDNRVTMMKNNEAVRSYDLTPMMKTAYSHVRTMANDGHRLLLSLHNDGLLSLDPHTGQIKRIEFERYITNISAFSRIPGENGLLLGTEDGIYRLEGDALTKCRELSEKIYNLTANGVLYDAEGKLWIGTYGDGVFIFDRNRDLVCKLNSRRGFSSNAITHMMQDSRGWIWIAGQDGLSCVRDAGSPEKYVNFGYDSGLPEVHIRSIQEDAGGNIWIAMNSSIARFDPRTERFESYDYKDGLPEGNFLDRSTALTDSGDMCFGSLGGVCLFRPQAFDSCEQTVPVKIVECQSVISTSDGSAGIPAYAREDNVVELPYDHNSIRLLFTVPDFSQSRMVEYAYMVEGLDSSWTSTNGERQATFRNLPPGEYTFRVRARLRNQEWDDAGMASIRIVVHPPLWWTWWAKLLYLLLAATVIYLAVRYYQKRLVRKNTLELERRKSIDEKELNDERLRFYTNITHELRTPLTLILGPLEDLVADGKMPAPYKNRIKIIHESTLRLLNLINQILEFRKTETQNRRLTVGLGNIGNLVMEVGLRYKELNRNEKVKFDIDVRNVSKDIYFDSEVITTVLNNLLSNAVKYTPSGHISLSLKEVKENDCDYVEIRVTDTGYGIEADALPHIFDRYYQAKGKHQASGIGLALVKSLSELHEAVLTVESQPGEGTSFRLLLLRDSTYPTALHKEFEDKAPESPAETPAIGPESHDDGMPVVLIVEDNEAIRDYIASSLSGKFRLLVAENGKEGLELALKNIPDVIISDVMMLVMDGIEMCRQIKSNINTSHIPVILLTAKDSIQDKEEGYESGADSYLTKPFSARLLISRIHNILESRRVLAGLIATKMEGDRPHASASGKAALSSGGAPLRLSRLDEEFLARFTQIVEDNILMPSLDMNFLQEALHMSHSSLYRKIKGLTGLSGNEFVRKIKLKHGYDMLVAGSNVSEAAYGCGFNDVGHFRNCFREEYGITPSAFLKDLKNRPASD